MSTTGLASGAALVLCLLAATPPALAAGACPAAWTVVPSPSPSSQDDNVLAAVAGRATDSVWAVGQIAPNDNPNITRTFVQRFDGSAWSIVPSADIGTQANALHGVAVAPTGQAWAVGYAIDEHDFYPRGLIESWDGTAWRVVDHPRAGDAADLLGVAAAAADDVWAVGAFQHPLGRFHTLVLHFDGRAWSVVPSPDPGSSGDLLYAVAAPQRGSVVAVGERTDAGPPSRALILERSGAGWAGPTPPPLGTASAALFGVAADPAGALRAVGQAETDLGKDAGIRALAETGRPGGRWAVQPLVRVGAAGQLYGIAAASDGTGVAVGTYLDPGDGRQKTLTERAAPGGRWRQLPSPNPSRVGDSQLGGVAVVGKDVWAVGAYDGPNALRTLILHLCL